MYFNIVMESFVGVTRLHPPSSPSHAAEPTLQK